MREKDDAIDLLDAAEECRRLANTLSDLNVSDPFLAKSVLERMARELEQQVCELMEA